jgi:hypothetical protein
LAVNGASSDDAGGYLVIVTGPAGVITSSLAQVAVQAPPAILSDPADATVLRGSRVDFSVSAAGSALSYQWQHEGLDVAGATNSTLTLTEAQTYNAGRYVAVVKNAVGNHSSSPARLNVLVPPLVMEFLGIAALAGSPPILTVNADPGVDYAMDISSNLYNWSLYSTFRNNDGIMDLADTDTTNASQRFYRLRWIPSVTSP